MDSDSLATDISGIGSSKIVFRAANGTTTVSTGGKSTTYGSPSLFRQEPGPAGGVYVFETINGVTYRHWMPANSDLFAGGELGKSKGVLVASSKKSPAPQTQSFIYGNQVTSLNVPLRGDLFKVLQEQQNGGPMSIGNAGKDNLWFVSQSRVQSPFYRVQNPVSVAGPIKSQGGPVWERNEMSSPLLDAQANFLASWEKGAAKRSGQMNQFFDNAVLGSPFRKMMIKAKGGDPNAGLSFWEKVGSRGLAAPFSLTVPAFEQTTLGISKYAFLQEARLFGPKGYQDRATNELKSNLGPAPFILAFKGMDPRKPEGLVNDLSLVAAPSFYNKGVKSIYAIGDIGKNRIPREALEDAQVRSGAKKFPSSKTLTPRGLANEFKDNPFINYVRDLSKRKSPVSESFIPKNRGEGLGMLDSAKLKINNLLKGDQKGMVSEGLPVSGSKVDYVDPWGNYFVIRKNQAPIQGGFHASDSLLKVSKGVQKGSSATPGGYAAPSLSTYFLKANAEEGVKFSLFPSLKRSSANFFRTQKSPSLIPQNYLDAAEASAGARVGSDIIGSVPKVQRPAVIKALNPYFENELKGSGKSAISPEFYAGKGEKETIVGQGSRMSLNTEGFNLWDKLTGYKDVYEFPNVNPPFKVIDIKSGEASTVFERLSNLRAQRIIRSSSEAQRPTIPIMGLGGSGSRGRGSRNTISSSLAPSSFGSSSGSNPISSIISGSRGGGSSIISPIIRVPSPGSSSSGGSRSSGGGPSRIYNPLSSGSSSGSRSRMSVFAGGMDVESAFSSIAGSKSRKSATLFSRLVKFKPKYYASVEAVVRNIKGKLKKSSVIKGLDLRPMRF